MEVDLNDEWNSFMTSMNESDEDDSSDKIAFDSSNIESYINMQNVQQYSTIDPPDSTPIYISTKSKLSYLNMPINLNIFWDIPITLYSTAREGCIKKQAKINSTTKEDLEEVQNKLSREIYVEQNIICHIDNPNGRIKFKDIRKVSVGICKKDLTDKHKIKQAFYNCLALIMRFKIDGAFREFHVKLFNTGRIEIPGIKNDEMYSIVLQKILQFIQPFYPTIYCKDKSDIVLINSNFNCGFYINRENLCQIFTHKYNIKPIYDPCHYPGVKVPFYYNPDLTIQTGVQIKQEDKDKYRNIVKIHCSIFRTGSVLILGTCTEQILNEVYSFITNLLKTEFKYICSALINDDNRPKSNKNKKRKSQKKFLITEDSGLTNEIVIDEIIDEVDDVEEVEEFVYEIIGNDI
jgi:TATA-box binding protein (TBP) (component of TFIID and TFIIIB)